LQPFSNHRPAGLPSDASCTLAPECRNAGGNRSTPGHDQPKGHQGAFLQSARRNAGFPKAACMYRSHTRRSVPQQCAGAKGSARTQPGHQSTPIRQRDGRSDWQTAPQPARGASGTAASKPGRSLRPPTRAPFLSGFSFRLPAIRISGHLRGRAVAKRIKGCLRARPGVNISEPAPCCGGWVRADPVALKIPAAGPAQPDGGTRARQAL